jgi:hypothetical protein
LITIWDPPAALTSRRAVDFYTSHDLYEILHGLASGYPSRRPSPALFDSPQPTEAQMPFPNSESERLSISERERLSISERERLSISERERPRC